MVQVCACAAQSGVATADWTSSERWQRGDVRPWAPKPRLTNGETTSVIKFDNVSATYPGHKKPALKDVTVEIDRGRVRVPGR